MLHCSQFNDHICLTNNYMINTKQVITLICELNNDELPWIS